MNGSNLLDKINICANGFTITKFFDVFDAYIAFIEDSDYYNNSDAAFIANLKGIKSQTNIGSDVPDAVKIVAVNSFKYILDRVISKPIADELELIYIQDLNSSRILKLYQNNYKEDGYTSSKFTNQSSEENQGESTEGSTEVEG